MKFSLYVAVLVTILAAVAILSYPVLAQGDASSERTLCLQDCERLGPPGTTYGQGLIYNDCIVGCESRFWKDIDRNSQELEKELK